MAKRTLPDMLVDILKENPTWSSLMKIIGDYTDQNVTQYIRQLEDIRRITQATDDDIVDESLRTLGFDIHRDFLESNGKNIRRAFYQVGKYFMINGNKDYKYFIEFLMGRKVDVQNLYTQDYINFYPSPLGNLKIDGGTWYSTSHVDLTVDNHELVEYLSINIGAGDIAYLKKRVAYDSKTEAEKTAFDSLIAQLMVRELNVLTDPPEIVEPLVDLRISSLFYEFAPIELVIRDIYVAMYAQADLYISMSAMNYPRDYMICETPGIQSMELRIPSIVQAGKEYVPTILVTWTDESQTTEYPSALTDSNNLIISNKPTIFKDPAVGIIGSTVVQARYAGGTVTKTVEVLAYGISPKPESIEIVGPNSIPSMGKARYRLFGKIANRTFEIEDAHNITWSLTSDVAGLTDSTIKVQKITENNAALIKAMYRVDLDGSVLTKQRNIVLSANLVKPVPLNIVITYSKVTLNALGQIETEVPVTDLEQGNTYRLNAVVHMSDGSVVTEGFIAESKNTYVPLEAKNVFTPAVVGEDYVVVFDVMYEANGESVTQSSSVMIEYPRIIITGLTITGPDEVKENSSAQYNAIASWSNGRSSFVTTTAVWSSTDSTDGLGPIKGIEIDELGIAKFPIVPVDTRAMVRARITSAYSNTVHTATKLVTVKSLVRYVSSVDLVAPTTLQEGASSSIHTRALWSIGNPTEVLPNRIEILKDDVVVVFADNVAGELQYSAPNLGIQLVNHPDQVFLDAETGLEHPVTMLEYIQGSNQPTHVMQIKVYYGNTDLSNIRTFVTSPKVNKVVNIRYSLPERIPEATRIFVPAIATYENGDELEVNARWSVTDIDELTDDLPVDIVSGSFTLPRIVDALIGIDEQTIIDMALNNEELTVDEQSRLINGDPIFSKMANRPITGQTWPQKLGILYAQYTGDLYRVMIQARNVSEDEAFILTCQYFADDVSGRHTVVNAPKLPTDKILSWYISGPVEIEANEAVQYSYSLVVDFDDEGEEYGVSNDWELRYYKDDQFDQQRELIRYLVDVENKEDILPMSTDGSGTRVTVDSLNQEDMDDILPIASVLDIDEDGYVYPKMNANVRAVIVAQYNDGQQQFEETLNIYMKKINANLLGLDMKLVAPDGSISYAFGNLVTDEPNQWAESLDNAQVYQLKVDLRRTDSPTPVEPKLLVLWRAEPTGAGISFDEATGRLYVAPQANDSDVLLIASYSEEFRETEQTSEITSETVEAKFSVRVYAHRALDVIELTGPDYTQDSTTFYPSVSVKRRDNTLANIFDVLKWEIVSAPDGVVSDGANGIVIPKLVSDDTMVLRAVATEGKQVITRDFTFNVLAGFVPEELLLTSNPAGTRDNAQFNMAAKLKIRNNTIPVDVTGEVYWQLRTKLKDLVIGNKSGVLTIPKLESDTEVVVTATYSRGNLAEPTKEHKMIVQSSFPLFWAGEANVITNSYFALKLSSKQFTRIPIDRVGRFSILPNSNEYLYFASPKNYGPARFAIVPSTTGAVDWGNMEPPVEVTRTYLDGSSEPWYIYRSVKRGFGLAEFSVTFG